MAYQEGIYTNKEISWLSFNGRVLQEAENENNNLADRIKFLSIYSSNLDEFFRVRVSMLKKFSMMGGLASKIMKQDSEDVLTEVRRIVKEQGVRIDLVFHQLVLSLEKHGVHLLRAEDLNQEQLEFVRSYFDLSVRRKIFPIMIDAKYKMPELKDHTLYLAVKLQRQSRKEVYHYSVIEVPTNVLPRFIRLPSHNPDARNIILVDEIVRVGLERIFSIHHYKNYEAFNIKLTRDAELDVEEDLSLSYLNRINMSVKKRRVGQPIRFVYDRRMPQDMLDLFIKKLRLNRLDVLMPGGRYHNIKDFMNFPTVAGLNSDKPFIPFIHKDINPGRKIFSSMRSKDILLYFPYHSFTTIIDLLQEASIDPKVEQIKVTLYRLADNSSIINALITAKKNRKEVTVVIELQARFDEQKNIHWAKMLTEEGVRVIFGIEGLKVHSKLCMITRKEKGREVRYCSIGTGNLNEDTARLYTDCCLLTVNPLITEEIQVLFDFFEKRYRFEGFSNLIVSPFNFREKMEVLIFNEIENAKNGKDAWINLKVNNLSDTSMVDLLYKASCAGVKIRIIVRSRFSVKPGMEGISENIEGISIVGEYLEHSRFVLFCNNNDPQVFIGSADWLTRNIERRIEVTCPIYDSDIKNQISKIFEIQWRDNFKARILDGTLTNLYRKRMPNEEINNSQLEVYNYLKNS